jgi:hypothetical protein
MACTGNMVAKRIEGTYEPPVVSVLLSCRKYDMPRMMWNRMRVRKKAMAKAVLLLKSGCNVMKPRKKVGTLFFRFFLSARFGEEGCLNPR